MTESQTSSSAAKATKTARVFIVDDHPIVRRGLVELVNAESDLEVCGEADNVADGLERVRQLKPDVATVDLSLGDRHGLELIKQIRAEELPIKLLVVSMMDESLYADRVLRAGASGYVRKEQATENIVPAIREVLDNKIYLSPSATARVLQQVAANETPKSPLYTLSDRELEVFELLGEGLGSRAIAQRMHLSVKTIETYREKIKSKLDLRNGSELTRHAIHWVINRGR